MSLQNAGTFLGLLSCELLDVGDVVPWVAIQRLLQPQLVEVVANETDGATEDEEAVQA
eukprot:CAMPEP_0197647988 /NCGR_PEP_ID=MMETSP1338-20131121/27143_1 /TAXON_ID=43686 ORGANISM="Pelagodinium beii, Strain RCC1491" /NCGR_SAMPLE_ID=MMETSP1338 /ASSEMBLY_ACC=CAM_ASM_000754 /LENGTH=57 /DNA_ID=CAMNT_0043221897 /DNA_START=113 /DNA_END=282 /DNA_ORIENTATION=+